MRKENPNLEPVGDKLAELEERKAEVREKKQQAAQAKAVEMKVITSGRLDGISNRARGVHE